MSITNFTPAPWHVETLPPGPRVMRRVRSERQVIAEVRGVIDNKQAALISDANAALIAAAPDLYTVLDAFLSDYEERGEIDYRLRQRAQAVLDKAVGR